MRKRVIAKGNLHKADHYRALITDTLPGDVPILISNDGFYKNIKRLDLASENYQKFVKTFLRSKDLYTIPYRYNILRPGGAPRKLSLCHPAGQISIAELYRDHGELICYYCRKSKASIRFPEKVGSLFFVRGTLSEKNALKGAGVDTVDVENTVSNPASYFAYYGVDRAYKFFKSSDYLRLEKRYAVMHYADISKCFSSIYTHTLYWALSDVQTAKLNLSAQNFSNRFDKLMQSLNYNETNGICVGAEFSRIFAELILAEVDKLTIERLAALGYEFNLNYEFRRYVDDYYIFSESIEVSKSVIETLRSNLSKFNMHLNENKTVGVPRPFITVKSRMVQDANVSLASYFEKFIENVKTETGQHAAPKRIRRSLPLLQSFVDSVKSSCFDNNKSYNETSNYIISSLSKRIQLIIEGFDHVENDDDSEENYLSCLVLLVETCYFFFNVDPSVPSSLRVAQAAILTYEFVKKNFPDRAQYVSDQIVRWTYQIVSGISKTSTHKQSECIPLEAINALLVLGEIGREETLLKEAIQDYCGKVSELSYFELISYVYCIGPDSRMKDMRDKLFIRAREIIGYDNRILQAPEPLHVLLDVLSCPYFDQKSRATLLREIFGQIGLTKPSKAECASLVTEFENNPWFVDWRSINLLSMIRKKELSGVYG